MPVQKTFLLFFALFLVGCSQTTMTAGANLAKAGQTAATQMEQNATVSSDSLLTFKKAVAFADGYNNAVDNAGSKALLTNINQIQSKIEAYAKMLESLSASYSALGNLASYDAAGEFNTSYASLVKDSNQLLTQLDSNAQIPQNISSPVQAGGEIIVGAIQADKVKEASKTIEQVLQTIIPVLEKSSTRTLLLSYKGELGQQINQTTQILFANGVYSYSPLLDELGAPMNLKSNNGSDAVVAKNEKLKAGLNNVMLESANEQADALIDSYDKSLSALKALVSLHESLQNGAPLNLDTLTTLTAQLQTIATSLQSSNPQSAKGK